MQPNPRFSILSLCLSSLLLVASARADLTITDTFKLGTPGRQAQGALDKTKTESGDAAWSAAPQIVFGGDAKDGWVVPGTKQGAALVALPSDAKRVEIDLDVKVTADNAGWIAVGFCASGNPSNCNFPNGMFLYVDNKGGSQIRANGLTIKVANKVIPDFQADGLNHLQLAYDKESNSVSAAVNKTTVAAKIPIPDFVPEISFAGFSNYGTNADSKADNLKIHVEGGGQPGTAAALPPKPKDVYRILFIGDSITQSRPNPNLEWALTAGMAASAENLDYVSLLTDAVGKDRNLKAEKKVFAGYGGKVESYTGRAAEYRSFQPDLVVLQFGENETVTPSQFESVYEALLKDVSGLAQKPAIVCVGIWSPGNNAYAGRWGQMEGIVKKLASKYGAGYAPVEKFAADPACRGAGANKGVQWHPNDAGMKGYADEILAAWKKLK